MVNGPFLPLRAAAGAVYDVDWKSNGPWRNIGAALIEGPLLASLYGLNGVLVGVQWIGAGVSDTVTGGYFEIAPQEATQLSLASVEIGMEEKRADVDRCGRSLHELKKRRLETRLTASVVQGHVTLSASKPFNAIKCVGQWSGTAWLATCPDGSDCTQSVRYGDLSLQARVASKPLEPEQPYSCTVNGAGGTWGEVRFCLNRHGQLGHCVRGE